MNPTFYRRPVTLLFGVLALLPLLATMGCRTSTQTERSYRMGELVIVGPLRYTIFDAEWKTQIGEGADARVPKNRFLVVHLSVTNSGGSLLDVPALQLERPDGFSATELSDPNGVSDWLGIIRKLKPADTLQGKVIFDVPLSAYRLRVSSTTDGIEEKSAIVDIPIQVTPATDPATGQPVGLAPR